MALQAFEDENFVPKTKSCKSAPGCPWPLAALTRHAWPGESIHQLLFSAGTWTRLGFGWPIVATLPSFKYRTLYTTFSQGRMNIHNLYTLQLQQLNKRNLIVGIITLQVKNNNKNKNSGSTTKNNNKLCLTATQELLPKAN